MAAPSSFVLQELTGDEHTLLLQGRALPYRPASFEGTMRTEFTWYPGNPVATVQMLGSKEEATTINGMWKDKYIGTVTAFGVSVTAPAAIAKLDGQQLTSASDLVQVVDGFRRRGQLLKVTWDTITRQGILTKFKQTWLRHEDVEWEIEFQWISQSDPLQPIAFAVEVPALDIASELVGAIDDLKALLQAPFALVSAIQNDINSALDSIDTAVSGISNAAASLSKALLSPAEAAKNIIAGIKSVQTGLQTVESALVSLPARAIRNVADITTLGQEQVLQAEQYARIARKASRDLRAKLAKRSSELTSSNVVQDVVQSFTAREGQDLRDVATQFYGTPDQWRSIAAYNKLHKSRLSAGQVVNVPKISVTGLG